MHLYKRLLGIALLATTFVALMVTLLAMRSQQQLPLDADDQRYLDGLAKAELWRDTEARRRSFVQLIQIAQPLRVELRDGNRVVLEQFSDGSKSGDSRTIVQYTVDVELPQQRGQLTVWLTARPQWLLSHMWFKLLAVILLAGALLALTLWRALIHERRVRECAEKIIAGERDPHSMATAIDHVVLTAFSRLLHENQQLQQEQVKALDQVRHRSFVDAETLLGNRAYFDAHLEVQLRDRDVNVSGMLLLMEVGDITDNPDEQRLYAQQIADVLRHLVREFNEPILARRDPLSYSVLLPGLTEREVDAFAKRLLSDVKQLHDTHRVGGSRRIAHIGIVAYRSGADSYKLLSEADMALRVAQQADNEHGWHRFEQGEIQQNSIMGRVRWRALLEKVIEQRTVQLFYHAVVIGNDRRVAHYEVLSRIPNDDGELFSAATFMPMAHRVGLAVQFDRLVCDIVLKSLLFGPQHSPVITVNLSGDAIADNGFRMWLLEHLAQNRLLAERLVFEIGEAVATHLTPVELSFFEMLNRCGSALCVEHVGHPQYSANYLQSGLYRFVKLHRGLTRDIVSDKQAQEFVRGLAALAGSLGAVALAECVENEAQWQCLLNLGVRGGQGYWFGKPTSKPATISDPVSV